MPPRRRSPEPTRRRPRGTGSVVFERDRGSYRAEVVLDGTRYRKRHPTYEEAAAWLDAKVAYHRGTGALPAATADAGHTVESWMRVYLTRRWNYLAINTRVNYESVTRNWILPRLGTVPLENLRRRDIEAWSTWLSEQKGKRNRRNDDGTVTKEPLSIATRLLAHQVLSKALKAAVHDGYLPNHPMDGVEPPKAENVQHTVASGRQVVDRGADVRSRAMRQSDLRTMLRFLKSHGCDHAGGYCELRWRLALIYALREGEALGLCWDSINLRGRPATIKVERHLSRVTWQHGCTDAPERDDDGFPVFPCGKKEGRYCTSKRDGGLVLLPGTKSGTDATRTLTIPDTFKPIITAHRDAQRAELAEAKKKGLYDPLHSDHKNLVFTTLPRGRALSPEQDQQWWERLQEEAGLSRTYSVHQCRHTALTEMVRSAVEHGNGDLRTVQEFAGHASVTTTALYVHPDLSMTDRALTATMAALADLEADEDETDDGDAA